MCRILFFVSILSLSAHCTAQQVRIENILLEGNKKTTEKAIFRELDFREGDSLSILKLADRFNKNKNQLLSTGLFNEVEFNLSNYSPENEAADVQLKFEENWYLFPIPIFELADRNFNVWWTEQNRDLSRINYGIRLSHHNFTGNRDPLKLKFQFGFTRKFELKYSYPYLSKNQNWGIAAILFYADNKTIGYKTENNTTLWHKNANEDILLKRTRIGPEIKFSPRYDQHHALRIEFHHNRVDEYVPLELNSEYFLNGATDLKMFFIEYDFQLDRRIYTLYPEGGFYLFFNAKKEGVGLFGDVDNLNLSGGVEIHTPIVGSLILGNRIRGKTNLSRDRPAFANNTAIGWDQDIVGGYELYVLDGLDFFISRNRLRVQLYEQNMKTMELVPKQFQKVNVGLYFRLNFDIAYVNEPYYTETNDLNNRWVYGYGPAFDVILFNNFLYSFEYSFNDIGEQGLYFHHKVSF